MHVVVGQRDPVVQAAIGLLPHDGQDLGFALEPVRLQVGDGPARVAQHVAVRRHDEFDAVSFAGGGQHVQRVQVGAHVAVGRIDHGGAAIEHMVAREQQAILDQHQAGVVGSVAGGEDDFQRVPDAAAGEREFLAVGQLAVGCELGLGARRGQGGQAPDRGRRNAHRLERRRGRCMVGMRMGADDGPDIAAGGAV